MGKTFGDYVNPYEGIEKDTPCIRANFHTHAGTGANTCGHYSIPEVVENYRLLGYGALCISNHDLYTEPKPFRQEGILLIPGYEYSHDPHVVLVGTERIAKGWARQQTAIDRTVADGGFAVLAHPNWRRDGYLSDKHIEKFTGYAGIEIFNGSIDHDLIRTVNTENRGDAADIYDKMLSKGKLVWCFGADDFHRWWHLGVAWNMIYAEQRQTAVVKAVNEGKFYVSTGLVLETMKLSEGGEITVSARGREGYYADFQYTFLGENGEILHQIRGKSGTYRMTAKELYVRVEVMSDAGYKLYTQPIYDTARMKKP